jgi:hypothetical protein
VIQTPLALIESKQAKKITNKKAASRRQKTKKHY